MMATDSSLQDCYFYFYSSCTKGNECPFRHCELALGTETVCSLWKEGRCFRSNCKFRHMESRINRSMIPCYWENQPGGCRKPHCVFFHRKLRNGIQVIKDSPGLILPTTDGKTSPLLPDLNAVSNISNKLTPMEKAVESEAVPESSLAPVPPLVLSFDEGEESDTESITSTPVKQGDKKTASTKNNPLARRLGSVEKDLGIKTLEQIRMEKIHKESDSYYGAAYTSAPLDAPLVMDQHYPPKTEFLALSKDPKVDKSLPAPMIEPRLSGVDDETDLRGRLSNRRNVSLNKGVSKKLDFKIKTLDEIRKEKTNKQSKSEIAPNNILGVTSSSEGKSINNPKEKTFKKLKINRKSRELFSVPDVLHEGKRKSDDDSSNTASKVIKLIPISSTNCEQVNGMLASSEEGCENHFQSRQDPKIQISFAASDTSLQNNPSPLSNLEMDKIVANVEMDSVITSSKSSHTSHIPDENEHTFKDKINNTQNSLTTIDSVSRNNNDQKKDSFIDRSMSVDDDLDDFLGDNDMTIDEMDSAPNDDILLQIEEFLES